MRVSVSPSLVLILSAQTISALVLFLKLVSPVPCLAAVISVALNRFVEVPTSAFNSAVTVVPIVRFRPWRCGKKGQQQEQRSGEHSGELKFRYVAVDRHRSSL